MSNHRQVKFTARERNAFHDTVRRRVDAYFKESGLSPHADRSMVLKTVVLVALYIVPFVALLITRPDFPLGLGLWFLMGLGLAGIGMSVMHDANHGAYSADERINWSAISNACSPLSGWEIHKLSTSTPNLAA